MTEQSNSAAAGSPEPIRPRRGRRWLFVTTVALVAALTGAMATRAVGQYGPPGWGHMHGAPWFMRGPLSAADVEDRVDRVVRHAAIELDATAEQQDKLRSIAKAAVKDLLPMREKARAARDRAKGLLTQPSDRQGRHRGVPRRADGPRRRSQQALRAGAGRCVGSAHARAASEGSGTPRVAQEPLARLAPRLDSQLQMGRCGTEARAAPPERDKVSGGLCEPSPVSVGDRLHRDLRSMVHRVREGPKFG